MNWNLERIMRERVFAVIGNTLAEEKYACKIKKELLNHGYEVYGVGKEAASVNDIEEDIDIIDLCINPVQGLHYIKECRKPYKCIVIQPGAESPELLAYLDAENIPYMEGCVLVGLSLYASDEQADNC